MEVLAATQNQGKLTEFADILHPFGITVVSPAEVGLDDLDVEETGTTFRENAVLKAKAFAKASGKPALADDSGLGVQALDGKPGVYSKRIGNNDPERIAWVLEQLKDKKDRTAWFIAAVCWYDPTTKVTEVFEGKVRGTIAERPQGASGFGYDPIFVPEGYQETFAQLGADIKNTISHRAKALEQLRQYLTAQAQV